MARPAFRRGTRYRSERMHGLPGPPDAGPAGGERRSLAARGASTFGMRDGLRLRRPPWILAMRVVELRRCRPGDRRSGRGVATPVTPSEYAVASELRIGERLQTSM